MNLSQSQASDRCIAPDGSGEQGSDAQLVPPKQAASASRTRFLHRLLDVLPGGRFTRSVAVLAGGTAVGQGIMIAASPVLTRLYSPDDFGILGVYMSLLGILSVVATLRYELAILLPEKDDDAAALVVLSLMIIPVIGLVVGLIMWFLRTDIANWMKSPALGPYLWFLPIGVVLIGLYQVFNYWAVRKGAFERIAKARLNQSAVAVAAQLAFFPFGPIGLILGHVLGSATSSGTLVGLAVRRDRPSFVAVGRHAVAWMATRYRRFPQVSALSGFINSGGNQLPVLLLAAFYGPYVAGQFALVQRVVSLPMAFIGQAVAQVYFGESASALRDSCAALYRLFLRVSKQLLLLAAVPMIVLLVAGPWLFTFVFGRNWHAAGQFARLLGPMVAAQLVASPLSQTLTVLERQTWQLGWDIFRLLLVVGSFATAAFLGWSSVSAVAAYSSAMLIAYLLLWGLQIVGIGRSRLTLSLPDARPS